MHGEDFYCERGRSAKRETAVSAMEAENVR